MIRNSVISSGDAHIFRRLTLRPNYIYFWQDRTSNHMNCYKANVFVIQSTENFMKIAFSIFSMSGYNSSIMPIWFPFNKLLDRATFKYKGWTRDQLEVNYVPPCTSHSLLSHVANFVLEKTILLFSHNNVKC